ncbi:hypothetical protein DFJ43DRAFT_1036330 [Lentinula guzmanii]|uniref:Uncharacterized protein n=1 Tax=Lentinula guzmanii TaxID=2804957 RepID=A0AA38N533_9AGAR|nr:hypothetical protein DFJ43DRAFT_1036330 [Lentinula guzmanii]
MSNFNSSSSLSSVQTIGTNLRRHRSIHHRSFQSIKHDTGMSLKQSIRSSKFARQSRPLSEDPVSVVRKMFVECGSEVDAEEGGARARLMNRQTARSFGGMEIVNEEDEDKEESCSLGPHLLETSQEHSLASFYSTSDSSGPPTPASCCSPLTPETIASCAPKTKNFGSFVAISKPNTQLPYLQNQVSATLSGLGITLPSTGSLSDEPQTQSSEPRFSTLHADHRVSVVTWSDLVSFSSYGTSMMDDDAQEEQEEMQDDYFIYDAEDKIQEEFDDNEDLGDNSLEDSGADLAAVLASMSILIGQGLDARLLLSPPRQFCNTFAS